MGQLQAGDGPLSMNRIRVHVPFLDRAPPRPTRLTVYVWSLLFLPSPPRLAKNKGLFVILAAVRLPLDVQQSVVRLTSIA